MDPVQNTGPAHDAQPAGDTNQGRTESIPQSADNTHPIDSISGANGDGNPHLQVPGMAADSSVIQEKIFQLMKMENLADITLAGYLIKLLRSRYKMSYKELYDEVSKCYDTLRRSDGSKYTGDLAKALKGCLTSSEIFKEVGENVWGIREKEAKMYEEKTTKKLKALINRKKGKTVRKSGNPQGGDFDDDDSLGDINDNGDSPGGDAFDMPEKFEKIEKPEKVDKKIKPEKPEKPGKRAGRKPKDLDSAPAPVKMAKVIKEPKIQTEVPKEVPKVEPKVEKVEPKEQKELKEHKEVKEHKEPESNHKESHHKEHHKDHHKDHNTNESSEAKFIPEPIVVLIPKEETPVDTKEPEPAQTTIPEKEAETKILIEEEEEPKSSEPKTHAVYELLSSLTGAAKQKDHGFLNPNPLNSLKGNENHHDLVKKLGEEKLSGVLIAVDYFAPILEEGLGNKGEGGINLEALNSLKSGIESISKKIVQTKEDKKLVK